MKAIHVLPGLLAMLLLQAAHADPIYKSVDSAGNVTYSSMPPEGAKAEQVDLPPPPSENEVRRAEQQMKQDEQQASDMEKIRLEQQAREQARADEEARQQQQAQPPVVIQQPVYVPQQGYYPPVLVRPPANLPSLPPRPTPR